MKNTQVAKEVSLELTQDQFLKLYNPDEFKEKVNTELDRILEDAENLIGQAGRALVTNKDQLGKAGDLIRMITVRVKTAEELRKLVTAPLNNTVKDFNAHFKARVEALTNALKHVTDIAAKWMRDEEERVKAEQDRQKREAEQEAIRQAEAKQAEANAARAAETEAAKKGDAAAATAAAEAARSAEQARDAALEAPAALPVADATVRGVRGSYGASIGTRKTWKAKVIDVRKLAAESMELVNGNDAALDAIRKALSAHIEPRLTALRNDETISPLPGVEFYQDSSPNIR